MINGPTTLVSKRAVLATLVGAFALSRASGAPATRSPSPPAPAAGPSHSAPRARPRSPMAAAGAPPRPPGTARVMLTGDVMLGRGVDQILPHHVAPRIYESYIQDARDYVKLAEQANGPLPQHRGAEYPWGIAVQDMAEMAPDAVVINLETAMTSHPNPWPGKGINYRCHPGNVATLSAAGAQVAALANNHGMDWGAEGLLETLATLEAAGIQVAGAGRDEAEACRPAAVPVPASAPAAAATASRAPAAPAAAPAGPPPEAAAGPAAAATASPGPRVLVWGVGHGSSGIPAQWEASRLRAGVRMTDLSVDDAIQIGAEVAAAKRPGLDIAVVSLHVGSNWGFQVPEQQRIFAHALIDAGVDVVHCHSSHHAKGGEVYRGRLVLYGAGDLISDYEGIENPSIGEHYPPEDHRDDVGVIWYADVSTANGALLRLTMTPTRLRHIRLETPDPADWRYIQATLDREFKRQDATAGVRRVAGGPSGGRLVLEWAGD